MNLDLERENRSQVGWAFPSESRTIGAFYFIPKSDYVLPMVMRTTTSIIVVNNASICILLVQINGA